MKVHQRMTFKNSRQFMIKTLECIMMAATIQLSLKKSEIQFLEENLENCSVEKPVFLGLFQWEKGQVQGYAGEVSSY